MEKGILMSSFAIMRDPRVVGRVEHRLMDILVITVCAVLAGCDDWVEIEDYGNEKLDWLKSFLELPNGIPSHDTFGRVFSLLEPEEFQKAFFEWVGQVKESLGREIISIDGKFLRASLQESGRPRSAIAIVSAWATQAGLCLGIKKSELKKEQGEKRATESLLDCLYLKGCIVTLDANGATPRITEKIVDKQADYMIGLKSNQKSLLKRAQKAFNLNPQLPNHRTETKGHGRLEKREYVQFDIPDETRSVEWRRYLKKWKGLCSVIKVTSQRTTTAGTTQEIRFYMSSLRANVEEAATAIRQHWTIENTLHWSLDVIFREDQSTVRIGHAAENLALLRRMTLNMLKQQELKKSIKRKRKKCGWDNAYMLQTLMSQQSL